MIRRHRDMWDLAAPSTTAGRLLAMPPEWTRDAVCASVDPEVFFPEETRSSRAARKVCLQCPVAAECFRYAISQPANLHGVWAGTTERERLTARARRRARLESRGAA